MIRTYSDLRKLESFMDRYNYLRLRGVVGESTFGFDRYLNQMLYNSSKWRKVRDGIILRDNGCDLGVEGYEIKTKIIIHHMNPITLQDIEDDNPIIYNPFYLICTSPRTHNAIHFSDESLLPKPVIERRPNDTCPWKNR